MHWKRNVSSSSYATILWWENSKYSNIVLNKSATQRLISMCLLWIIRVYCIKSQNDFKVQKLWRCNIPFTVYTFALCFRNTEEIPTYEINADWHNLLIESYNLWTYSWMWNQFTLVSKENGEEWLAANAEDSSAAATSGKFNFISFLSISGH